MRAAEKAEELPLLKLMRDHYGVRYAKETGVGATACTASSYVLEGWVPLAFLDRVDKMLAESGESLSYYFVEPQEGDDVPSLAMNN